MNPRRQRHQIGATPPSLDADDDLVRAYVSQPDADPSYIREVAESLNLLRYTATAAVIAKNPNAPLDVLFLDDIVWRQAESFIQNPALPLHLLESPTVFSEHLKTEIGYDDTIDSAMEYGFGWTRGDALDYQMEMRELFLGPVIGELSGFGGISSKTRIACNLPGVLYLTANGFLVAEYPLREFICDGAYHFWNVWDTELHVPRELEEQMHGVTVMSYFKSATRREGNWQPIIAALRDESTK